MYAESSIEKLKLLISTSKKHRAVPFLSKGFNYHIFDFEKAFIVPMQSADAVVFIGNRVKSGKKILKM